MLHFQLELIGGPGDGWRSILSVTPGEALRVRMRCDTVEILLPEETERVGRLAEYRFRDVSGLSNDGPRVSLRYDFRQFVADAKVAATPQKPMSISTPTWFADPPATAGTSKYATPPSAWRRLIASVRHWFLAPVDYPRRVR